jgi:hypothetical protein
VVSKTEPSEDLDPRLVLQPANKAVDVAEYKKVSHLGTLEGEDGHARPPDVAAARRHYKQFLAMRTVESHLAADVIAFLDHRQNVRCVLAKRSCYEVDIASKLVMAEECRSKRATKSETFVEDDRYETLVCVVVVQAVRARADADT